jgi:hypothetical protein
MDLVWLCSYKQLFFDMDLSDFCFSYTYDLTHSLQHNITSQKPAQCDDRFVWNHFLLQPLIKGRQANRSTQSVGTLLTNRAIVVVGLLFGLLLLLLLLFGLLLYVAEVGENSCWVLPMINGYFRQNSMCQTTAILLVMRCSTIATGAVIAAW